MRFQETEVVELKAMVQDDIKKEIIAFTNCNGGTVYIGVADNGDILGVENADECALQISNMVRDAIKPDVTMFIHYETLNCDGREVVAVNVQRGTNRPYYLAKKGTDVIVLEGGDHIGNGGSSRNGGGVRQSGRDPRELPLVMYGIKNLWPSLSEELEVDCEYHQDGNLRLGKNDKHKQILEGLTERAVKVGLDVRMIDGDEVRRINPYLSDEVTCASWCPTDGHANPLTTTLGFYKTARKLGVRFITGEKVIELKKIKGRLRQVITPNNIYEADTVVVAAGYESKEILGKGGIDVPKSRVLIEALVTESEPHKFDQILGTAEADFYGHQTKHGSFVFGGSSGYEAVNKDNGTPICSSITAPCICRGIMKYFPDLADAKIVRTWAGWADQMKDGVPVLGNVSEVPGLVLATGFCGHGFGIAPAIGHELADLIVDGKTSIDINALRYDRFKAKI